jgi:hypothetical protein
VFKFRSITKNRFSFGSSNDTKFLITKRTKACIVGAGLAGFYATKVSLNCAQMEIQIEV